MKRILLALLLCTTAAHADDIDTVLFDNADGSAVSLYGCQTWLIDDNGTPELIAWCAGYAATVQYTPLDSVSPMIEVGVIADSFEYWPSTGNCVVLRAGKGEPFGQNVYEVSCGDVIFRSGSEN